MCSECKQTPCVVGCPNYESPKTRYYCSVCNDAIHNGEEYIRNDDGEYAHWECVDYVRDLAKFLGCEIKRMEVEDD